MGAELKGSRGGSRGARVAEVELGGGGEGEHRLASLRGGGGGWFPLSRAAGAAGHSWVVGCGLVLFH